MFYVTVNVKDPIKVNKGIVVQKGLTTKFPPILFELHNDYEYFDLGDSCVVTAAITNTDQETATFKGTIDIINPHRGQIQLTPVTEDFTMTGINTLTVKLVIGEQVVSFQSTVFVQSVLDSVLDALK